MWVAHRRATAYLRSDIFGSTDIGECSGIAISPYHILTAAHCVNDIDFSVPEYVRFGKNDGSGDLSCRLWNDTLKVWEDLTGDDCKNPLSPRVDGRNRYHWLYKEILGYPTQDVAIVRLKYNINRFDDIGYYHPLEIASPDNFDGMAHLFGYGGQDCARTSVNTSDAVVGPLRRGWKFDVEGDNGDRFIIDGYQPARDNRTWVCQGDSGGPVFNSDNELIGLISMGYRDWDYATKLSPHVDWIQDIIAEDDMYMDPDGDWYYINDDNCPDVFNPSQYDYDGDNIGYHCDDDIDFSASTDAEAQDIWRKEFVLFGDLGVFVNDRAFIHPGTLIYGDYVEIGSGAEVDSVWAGESGVFLRDYSNLDYVRTEGEITYQNESSVTISGDTKENINISVPSLSDITVSDVGFSVETGEDVKPEPYSPPVTLVPGRHYDEVVVKSRTTVILDSCARYYMNSLVIEPEGDLVVRGAECGWTRVFVRDNFGFRGEIDVVNGETLFAPRILFVVFDSGTIPIESSFVGSIVAPDGVLNFSAPHLRLTGSYFARYIYLHQDSILTWAPFSGRWVP